MAELITTLGPLGEDKAGLILPHEHVFVDLRKPDAAGAGKVPVEEVTAAMTPLLEEARRAGVGAMAEASCVGVGRRADVLKAVSDAAQLPLIAPTGIYREPWIPAWVHSATEDELYAWMLGELTGQIEESGVRAGWIKHSASEEGLTPCEMKVLRAAVRAARETGCAIGSQTLRGGVVMEELSIIESLGYDPGRFIWIHAHIEEDFETNLTAARRGAWIEYDAIGAPNTDRFFTERIIAMLDAGLGDRLLLSQDRGWYDPAKPGGGEKKSYTYLAETFLPGLCRAGVDGETVNVLTRQNPFLAFAR